MKNFKEIIEIIKRAEPPTKDIFPAQPISQYSPVSSGNVGTGTGSSTQNVITNMQQAIVNLISAVVTDQSSFNMPIDRSKVLPTSNNPEDQSITSSKANFNQFIIDQYGKKLNDGKGIELDTSLKPDGAWGPQTDNALHNILSLAYALLQFESDLGLHNPDYDMSKWKLFQGLISYTMTNGKPSLPSTVLVKRANALTNHLKAILKMYNNFRLQVTTQLAYRDIIKGNHAIDKYTSNQNSLLPDDLKTIENKDSKVNVTYPISSDPNKKIDYIPLISLYNKDNFLSWMKNNGVDSESLAIKIFNNVIKPKIERL